MATHKPEKVFRLGNVSASIFAHQRDDQQRTFRSVSVQKRIKDGDEVKYLSSFSLGELPVVIRVYQLALGYLEEQEAEIQLPD